MSETDEKKTSSLTFKKKLSYGVGHVFNDLCASMWFSYLLVYLVNVVQFSNGSAGVLMLIGQVSDAIATPLVGIASDHTKGCAFGIGKRKLWYLIGTVCVICSFPFLFNQCFPCNEMSAEIESMVYYVIFVVVFQFGWASVQISHLALIPDITTKESERVYLNAYRNAFTMISNLIVYSLTWLYLSLNTTQVTMLLSATNQTLQANHTNQNMSDIVESRLTPDDAPAFMKLSFTAIGIGALFTVIFFVGISEKKHSKNEKEEANKRPMQWHHWLKNLQFYEIAVLYMVTRLIVNLIQVYTPFYLTDTLKLEKVTIAYIPLASYISGLVASFVIKPINKRTGNKVCYFAGLILVFGGCAIVWSTGLLDTSIRAMAFVAVAILGAGSSILLIMSLAMTADLIGEDSESGAFVYGSMSFTDKLSNGLVIVLIQYLQPCSSDDVTCTNAGPFYRSVLTYVVGSSAILGLLILTALVPQKIGQREATKPGEKSDLEIQAKSNYCVGAVDNSSVPSNADSNSTSSVDTGPGSTDSTTDGNIGDNTHISSGSLCTVTSGAANKAFLYNSTDEISRL